MTKLLLHLLQCKHGGSLQVAVVGAVPAVVVVAFGFELASGSTQQVVATSNSVRLPSARQLFLPSPLPPPRNRRGIADRGQPIWGACRLAGHSDVRPSGLQAWQRPQPMQAPLPGCSKARPGNRTPFFPGSLDHNQCRHRAATCQNGVNWLAP